MGDWKKNGKRAHVIKIIENNQAQTQWKILLQIQPK